MLNGTSTVGLGTSTATNLSTRGFDVVGQASDAANSNYTSTVIEYAGAAELPAAQTLAQLFGNVTLRPKAHLAGPALRLILGSSFTALKAATGGSGISNLAGTYGGITGNVNICRTATPSAAELIWRTAPHSLLGSQLLGVAGQWSRHVKR